MRLFLKKNDLLIGGQYDAVDMVSFIVGIGPASLAFVFIHGYPSRFHFYFDGFGMGLGLYPETGSQYLSDQLATVNEKWLIWIFNHLEESISLELNFPFIRC